MARRASVESVDMIAGANSFASGLFTIRGELDGTVRDWAAYQRQAVEFHLRNARAWAGEDLAAQVDPDFTPSAR